MKNFGLSLLGLILSVSGFAYDFKVGGIYYNYDASTQSAIVTHADGETISNRESYKGDITIPEEVVYNNRTMKVTAIGAEAFASCRELTSIVIPNTVTVLDRWAFIGCSALKTIELNKVEFIESGALRECTGLTQLKIPNTVKSIGTQAFQDCENLRTLVIEDGENNLSFSDGSANQIFYGTQIESLYLGRNIVAPSTISFKVSSLTTLSIGKNTDKLLFDNEWAEEYRATNCSLVYSFSENPTSRIEMNIPSKVYVDATLYVPTGTKEKYMAAEGWKNFFNIQEMDVADMWDGNGEPTTNGGTKGKCKKPTIRYSNGKLLFESATEGAVCQSSITDTDITSYSGNEVQLGVTYHISVYATAAGYENSDVATATLCWVDVEPKTDGIENGISQVRANAVLIQSSNGMLNVTGIDSGTNIAVYNMEGVMVGSAKSLDGTTSIATGIRNGEIAIVKIGEKTIKVLMK